MAALMLGRRGLPVRLIERRDDMRVKKQEVLYFFAPPF
jgi:hypothetical protein